MTQRKNRSTEAKSETGPARSTREEKTVRLMLELYCRDHHASSSMCEDCKKLWEYVQTRLAKCPFRSDKPTCANCTVHCYKPTMREQIRTVMRYSGPRMAYRHPVLSVLHILDGRKLVPSNRLKGAP